jgi:hypothetical protein
MCGVCRHAGAGQRSAATHNPTSWACGGAPGHGDPFAEEVHTLGELTVLVKTRLRRMQYRPALLAGFLASTGLGFGPFL